MRKLLDQISRDHGKLNGIVYAASPIGEAVSDHLSDPVVQNSYFRSTVGDLAALGIALKGLDLDFCLLQSSLHPVSDDTQMTLQWASALLMDAFAMRQNRSDSFPWISVSLFSNRVAGNGSGNGAYSDKSHDGQDQEAMLEVIEKVFLAGPAERIVVKPDGGGEDAHGASVDARVESSALDPPSGHARPELEDTYVMPRNDLERRLVAVWSEALGFERVGIHDNFFDLGGHSLLATQLLSQIRETVGAKLSVRDLFENQTIDKLAKLIMSSNGESDEQRSIVRVSRDGEIPLSFAQQRLWFLDQLEPGSFAYNIPAAVRLEGRLDLDVLERTLNEIIQRHEALRTTFSTGDGSPVQVIAPTFIMKLSVIDLRGIDAQKREAEAVRLATSEGSRAFDLTGGPLLRASFVQMGEDDYVLLINMHHIISDGWSIGIFVREVVAIYEAFAQGKPLALPELPIQYADFAVWQQSWLTGDVLKEQLNYWKGQLKNLPTLELITDRPRPPIQTYSGSKYNFTLSMELTRSLNSICHESEATLFMTLLAAFQILLCRYSDQEDIAVGSPIANRNRAELEHLMGCFVNTLVLRVSLSDNPSFRSFLRRVRDVALESYAHQDLPFEYLVDALQPRRDMSHSPLFQVMFILQNTPKATLQMPGLKLSFVEFGISAAKFDLTLAMEERADGIAGTLEYKTALFNRDTIRSMVDRFERLLTSIASDQDAPVMSLDLLTEIERRKILIEWNETRKEYGRDQCTHHLIESQARQTPEGIALTFGDEQATYGEINSRANQLAHFLTRMGAGPDALVGICMERSLEMIVALLGIHKAGCGYLPVDPDYPQDRIAFMLEDAAPLVVLTQRGLLANPLAGASRIVCIDGSWEQIALESRQETAVEVSRDNLAYVIYTSGSTGKPKGVQISHGAVVNFLNSMKSEPGLTSDDRLLAVTTLSFDISVLELWLPLTVGGQVILVNQDTASNPTELLNSLTRSAVSAVQATPVTWRLLIEAGWSGTPGLKILCGGEALARDLADQLLERGASVWNLYGPTETTIWSTIFNVARSEEPVYIGRAIANTQLYVLDRRLQPVPTGVPGELYISGDGVSRGYLNQPAMTADKFIPNPFNGEPGMRIYRTGDLVRYRPDGNVEFLGRVDDQVKIHGRRIEVREIEVVLSEYPSVINSVVTAERIAENDKRLIAYIVFDGSQPPELDRLRKFLKSRLPDYMVPFMFVEVSALPLTPNGKVDRKLLPSPDYSKARPARPFVVPVGEVEEEMAAIWSDLLGIERVGANDNFFDLGGHSLLISRLVARVHKRFSVQLPVRRVFQSPTISELAQAISTATSADSLSIDGLPEVSLEQEAVLDPAIRPRGELSFITDPQHVFLTGGTGFIGAFLLRELLDKTSAKVYCLVRAASNAESLGRLQNTLKHYLLWDDSLSNRIIPIMGDLGQPLLGLSPEAFHGLAATIDCIYHNGASVNFIYPYSMLKAPNVLGTQEVLRLACEEKLKPVHYVSTLSVFHGASDGLVTEETGLSVPPRQDNGYVQSKWVAERLVSIGRSRGIPTVIYRLGRITGHSQTGVSNTNDLFFRMTKSCIQLGSAPDMDVATDVTPVDYVSKAIVQLSRQEKSLNRNFHLVNTEFLTWNTFVDWIRSYGYQLERRPYNVWLQELKQATNSGADNALIPLMPIFNEWAVGAEDNEEEGEKVQAPFDSRNAIQDLTSTGISCSPINKTLINRYLSYFARTGAIKQPPNGSLISEASREGSNFAANS
jgi:amino acid adenylation domain-containing protein/thioester reductase-like protein